MFPYVSELNLIKGNIRFYK